MKRAFSLPLVLIVTLLTAIAFFVLIFVNSLSRSSVKGASALRKQYGVTFQVSSTKGSWEMHEYLCITKEDCLSSLESGKKWQIIGGGADESHDIFVESEDSWNDYSYLKVFVKPAWGAQGGSFSATVSGNSNSVMLTKLTDSSNEYSVVLVPIKSFNQTTVSQIIFSDK